MDTLLLADTLRDTIWIRDTLTLIKETNGANIAVAIGTFFLALATLAALLVTIIWNIRNEKKTQAWNRKVDEWNERNEWMRFLPLLRISKIKPGECVDLTAKKTDWLRNFTLKAENVGVGPVLTAEICATQDPHEFTCTPPPTMILGPKQEELFRFELRGTPSPLAESPAPPITIKIKLRDIHLREIFISYKVFPLHNREGKHMQSAFGMPFVSSLSIDGKSFAVPEAEEYGSPKYQLYQRWPQKSTDWRKDYE